MRKPIFNSIYFRVCLCFIFMFILFGISDTALAAFDLDKGVGEATAPIVEIIKKYYGIAIAIGVSVGAITGQGDFRTRAISAAIGAGVAGGVILAMLSALA